MALKFANVCLFVFEEFKLVNFYNSRHFFCPICAPINHKLNLIIKKAVDREICRVFYLKTKTKRKFI